MCPSVVETNGRHLAETEDCVTSGDIWRAEDGMFVEHWDELNLMEMFQQMGALPPLGAGPEA